MTNNMQREERWGREGGREREGDRKRQRDRDRERQTGTERDTQRERFRPTYYVLTHGNLLVALSSSESFKTEGFISSSADPY